MANGVALAALAVLGVIAVVSGVLAARHRVAFRLAIRNVRRGRGRTVLLILGLLVGTTIVSGSLVIGDTVNSLVVHFVYQDLGHVDEAVLLRGPAGGVHPFSIAVFDGLNHSLSGDPEVAGLTPMVVSSVGVYDRSTGIPEAGLNLVGANASQSGALGPFTTPEGRSLAGPSPGGVYLDAIAAGDVNASVGDSVVLYATAQPVSMTLQAIVNDDTRGGFQGGGTAFVDLAAGQALLGYGATSINYIAVANAGTIPSAVEYTGAVDAKINASLAAIGPVAAGIGSYPVLQQGLSQAQTAGQSFLTLFLVLGLFSIAAGAMLIVGIFVMLGEERKGEMGTLRALGLKRRDLVYTFYFEGLVYSAGAALAGTLLGIVVAYGMTYAFSVFLASGTVTGQAILGSFTATAGSLLTAYLVGFCLTLVTVVLATARVGRLNIVRALRSIPEPPPPLRLYTGLAYLGAALAALGLLLLAATGRGSGDVSVPMVGGGLAILGGTLVASRFVRNRIAFSAGGALLIAWGGVSALRDLLLGTEHSGTIFVVFVEGIFLVLGAVMLYTFNASTIVGAVSRAFGRSPRSLPVVRIGLSYPGRRPFRTAVTLTIFALVLFTIVAVASFGNSLEANVGHIVEAESGGYTFVGFSEKPIPDLPAQIASNASLAPEFTDVVPVASGAAYISEGTARWTDSIYAAPTNATGSTSLYTTNRFNFTATWQGLSTAEVWQRLATDPTAAIVDSSYAQGMTNFGTGSTGHPQVAPGTQFNLTNRTGASRIVTVIGVMDQSFVTGVFVNPVAAQALGIRALNVFFLGTPPGVSPTHAMQLAQKAFFADGLQLFDFAQILRSSLQTTEAIIGLLEVFVGLGLAVGIAAVGIVALRAVVERRAEIGMLRATGFKRRGILGVFLFEYSYVVLLGIGIGTALGVLLVYNASTGTNGLLTFAIPWLTVGEIVGLSYVLTLLAILGPSLRAARLPPAEAVRYSE